jgi:hypothetical protein
VGRGVAVVVGGLELGGVWVFDALAGGWALNGVGRPQTIQRSQKSP